MKEGRGTGSLVAGVVCLLLTLLVGALEVLPPLGIELSVVTWASSLLNRFFSFTVSPAPFSLIPLAVLLGLWTIMIFTFRVKNRFLYVLIPLTGIMAYTLYSLSHLMQGSTRPI